MTINAQYNVAKSGSLPVRIAAWQRRRMFERFLGCFNLPDDDTSILDLGATSERTYAASNYLEAWYPRKDRITASGIDDAQFLEEMYPGIRFVQADACNLQFDDRSFDVVHAAAVIEHVGSADRQIKMISETARVANRGFFITTPNRWFPIEFHTVLPVVHWLPKRHFRTLMRATGRSFFAEESNLNLMSRSDLLAYARLACEDHFDISVVVERLALWPANLIVIGHRKLPIRQLASSFAPCKS
jgi:SAM-dependent methyltransferase